MQVTCDFCSRTAHAGDAEHGFWLCGFCLGGDLPPTLRWGAAVSRPSYGLSGSGELSVRGSRSIVAGRSSFRANFSEEHIGHRLVKLFARELEAGDEVFDDDVYVDTNDKERVQALLAFPGAREAILAVTSAGARVEISGAEVRVTGFLPADPTHPLIVAAAALQHYLERTVEPGLQTGSERSAEL